MTEVEYLDCTDPKELFRLLKCRLKHRKLRLFAVACCRKVAKHIEDERSLTAIEVAERFADGRASDDELHLANDAARAAHRQAYDHLAQEEERDRQKTGGDYENLAKSATCIDWAAVQVADPVAWKAAESVSWMSATPRAFGGVTGAEYAFQANLIRDIFGNPFQIVAVDPVWLNWNDCAPKKLAHVIYDSGDFERLPDLAGVLEAADCRDNRVLAHCRYPGPHVRGCWVVDAMLGKS